jgi:hypothetical protein
MFILVRNHELYNLWNKYKKKKMPFSAPKLHKERNLLKNIDFSSIDRPSILLSLEKVCGVIPFVAAALLKKTWNLGLSLSLFVFERKFLQKTCGV